MKSTIESRKFFLLIIIIFSLILYSCEKFIEIKPAPDLLETSEIFSNDHTALSAVTGLYIQMRRSNLSLTNGGISVFTGLSGDEIYNTSSNAIADPFFNNTILPADGTIEINFWTWAYKNIYQANSILNGLENSYVLTDSIKNQLLGETKVIRALNYFYLVNLFGDVPLITSTDYHVNETMNRTPAALVYKQMINDLTDAQRLLSTNYAVTMKARPNKYAASALLARAYLYQKDWPMAETQATSVIDSKFYDLEDDLNNVFLPQSHETIWQIVSDNSNTAEGNRYIPFSSSVTPSYALTDYLLDAFESGDQRKRSWLDSNKISGRTYYFPYKYKARGNSPISEYHVVLRLGEQYLIRAEARAQQNDITGARADLNIIRSRAGLLNTNANSKEALLQAIQNERRIELFSEWGNRWLDLKRTGKIDVVLGVEKPDWKPASALYPIPSSEIDLNQSLTQNDGY